MTKISKEVREQMAKDAIGKVIADLHYEEHGDYYVMTFEDGSEICFIPMVDLI